jgi:hypothetical protein
MNRAYLGRRAARRRRADWSRRRALGSGCVDIEPRKKYEQESSGDYPRPSRPADALPRHTPYFFQRLYIHSKVHAAPDYSETGMSLSSELEVTLLAGPYNDLVISNQCVSNHSESPGNRPPPTKTDHRLLTTVY